MQTKRYSFGEYIIKRGEIPKGLIIITEGLCKLGYDNINFRKL
jgi:CRP-like cAMP-binding protein